MKASTNTIQEIKYDASVITQQSLGDFALHLGENSGKYLAVAPSHYEASLVKDHLDCFIDDVYPHLITSDTHAYPATTLRECIEKINVGACVGANIIVTTQDVLRQSFTDGQLSGMGEWSLCFYGTIDLFSTQLFNFYDDNDATEFLAHFGAIESSASSMMLVQPTSRVEVLVNNIIQGGSINSSAPYSKPFIESISSCAYLVYLAADDHKKIVEMKPGEYAKTYGKISTLAVLKPEVIGTFGSVFIRAPFFEKSVMYSILKEQGFSMRETCIGSTNAKTHQNGSRASVYYVTDGVNSANYKGTRPDPKSTKDYEDYIVEHYASKIGAEKFVYCTNPSTSRKPVYTDFNSVTADDEDGQGVPLISVTEIHGQYEYGIYTRSGIYSESERSALIAYGIDPNVLDRELEFLLAYEFAIATRLSNVSAKNKVNIYVVNEAVASALTQVFSGAGWVKLSVPNVQSWEKKLSDMPISYNDYKSYQRVNKRFNEGARSFSKKTARRYIETCEVGGLHLVNENPVYDYLKNLYG